MIKFELFSIEDLINIFGPNRLNTCLYCYLIYVANKVDLLLLPYNYLFKEEIRKTIKLQIEDKIIVVDEAHNLESFVE